MWLNNIEKADTLPKKLGMRVAPNNRNYFYRENYWGAFSRHNYKIIDRILYTSIGMPINDVYNKFLTKFPNASSKLRSIFWRQIDPQHYIDYYGKEGRYYLNDGILCYGEIQKSKFYISIASPDFGPVNIDNFSGKEISPIDYQIYIRLNLYAQIWRKYGLSEDMTNPTRRQYKGIPWYAYQPGYKEKKEEYEDFLKKRRAAYSEHLYDKEFKTLREKLSSTYFYSNYTMYDYYMICNKYPLGISSVIKGTEKRIYSGSREFMRHMAEARVKSRKADKQRLKEQKEKSYCFLTQSEIQERLDKQNDIITRDRLGFDETSFIGEHYHGQKRKKGTRIQARRRRRGNSD